MDKSFRIRTFIFIFFISATLLFNSDAIAQCAMCKASAESNMKEHTNNFGAGLNKGILYLLAMPYILCGVGVFIWYRHRKQYRQE